MVRSQVAIGPPPVVAVADEPLHDAAPTLRERKTQMHKRHVFALSGLSVMLLALSSGLAEHSRAAAGASGRAKLPGPPSGLNRGQDRQWRVPSVADSRAPTIDDQDTPELIPDYVAYRHLIMAAAISDTPSEYELSRREAYLARVGLAAIDRNALVAAVGGVRAQLNAIAPRANNL